VTSFISKILTTSPVASSVEVETIDVKTFNLPLFDHPSAPAMFPLNLPSPLPEGHPALAWSKKLQTFDAYILVTPEYNGGLPAGFKNALDYTYYEFTSKPFFTISYGVHGGNFANEEASRAIGVIMKGKVVDTKVLLPWAKDEMMLPTAEGKLGPKTLEAWEGQKGEVLKGFEELIGLLKEEKVAEEIAA
jgi:NAD(P)H-dependent FMN reductase